MIFKGNLGQNLASLVSRDDHDQKHGPNPWIREEFLVIFVAPLCRAVPLSSSSSERVHSYIHQFFFGGCRCTSFHLFPHLFLGYVIHNMYTSIYALILFLGNLRQRKVHLSGVARLTQGPSVWAAPHVCWYVPVLLNRDRLYLTTFFGWFPIFCWLNLYIHS